jgi:hypothetical protein
MKWTTLMLRVRKSRELFRTFFLWNLGFYKLLGVQCLSDCWRLGKDSVSWKEVMLSLSSINCAAQHEGVWKIGGIAPPLVAPAEDGGEFPALGQRLLEVEVEITLRLTISQSVSQSVSQYVLVSGTPLGRKTRFYFFLFFCRKIALLFMLGRPLWREDGSVICSAICPWPESRRIHNHTLLSRLRLLGSLSVASYDSQGLQWKYSYPQWLLGEWAPRTHWIRRWVRPQWPSASCG